MHNKLPTLSPCCCRGYLSNSPKEPAPWNERTLKAIHVLQLGRLSLYSALLDPADKAFAAHCDCIYACPKDRPDGKLAQLFDCLCEDHRGKVELLARMEPRMLQSLARKVYDEMDDIKRILNRTMHTIMPEFSFEVGHQFDSSEEHARACIRPERDPRECHKINLSCQGGYGQARVHSRYHSNSVMILSTELVPQLAKVQSDHWQTLYFAALFTLFFWTNGASYQTIEALANVVFVYRSLPFSKLLDKLASRCLDQAAQIAQCPHIHCYDSININTSIFNALE